MDRPKPVTLVHAKDHPIVPQAVSWGVESIRLEVGRAAPEAVRAWVVLRKGRERVRLRFDGVTDFSMAPGFPDAAAAVRILDVSHLLWQHVNVRVESACGALGFWAASVVEEGDRAERGPPAGRRT